MESINQCHCCLQRPSAKDLRTPYTLLGITEIYSVMLEECFAMRLTSCDDGKSGICKVCLGRLREACLFKLQVQHCQAELQERLEGGLSVKEEALKDEPPEDGACSESPEPSLPSDEEPLEPLPEDEAEDHYLLHDAATSGGEYGVSTAPLSSRVMQQLALACSVRLERLRHSSRASQPCPVTSHREPSPAGSVQDVTSHREPSPACSVQDVTSHREPSPAGSVQDVTSHREPSPAGSVQDVTSHREPSPACSVQDVTSHREPSPAGSVQDVTSHRESSPASSVQDESGDTPAEEQAYMSGTRTIHFIHNSRLITHYIISQILYPPIFYPTIMINHNFVLKVSFYAHILEQQ
ncbi:uncharacterized protein LOC134803158 isoform X2 [Cydia splendana]|uniref:uncharacterized protein LOC134803158 isoform X2 n=1 Tax=Cydia splendana TaxID=1100963 RepID=UPI00300D9778